MSTFGVIAILAAVIYLGFLFRWLFGAGRVK